MPVVNGREYRNLQMTFQAVDPEDDEDESLVVEGYATTFDEPYELYEGFYEVIDRHALDGADMSDVIFQLNHCGSPLARQRNGSLAIMCDDHGLFVRANLNGCDTSKEVHRQIKSGLIDRMSWGFMIAEDGWEYDRETKTSTITKVSKVFDVSAVSIPANEGTEIHARSYFDGVIEAEDQELAQREQELLRRKRRGKRLLLETKGAEQWH